MSNSGEQQLAYGSRKISFTVSFARIKRVYISVFSDRSVAIRAPESLTLPQVLAVVERRSAWIAKQQRHFEKYQSTQTRLKYFSGETVFYLGRRYRLKVLRSSSESIKLKGHFLTVSLPDRRDTVRIRDLVSSWYKERAREVFSKHLQSCQQFVIGKAGDQIQLRIREMSRSWGRCSRKGRITLNLELIMAPVRCIDYVIIHELCHIKYPTHSRGFYRLLTRVMPDWEERKRRLDQLII